MVTHILNDVLSLQKIEDGALSLDCAPFDIERMVRSTLYSFKAPCRERNLRLLINLDDLTAHAARRAQTAAPGGSGWAWPPALPPPKFGVMGDVHRLRQVGLRKGKGRTGGRLDEARAAAAARRFQRTDGGADAPRRFSLCLCLCDFFLLLLRLRRRFSRRCPTM